MLDLNLQVINGSEYITIGRGDAERALRETFEKAVVHARSAQHAASVIFIDEVDALCPKRQANGGWSSSAHSRIIAQLLTLLDGVEGGLSQENVVVVAATNLPNSIDPALRRPGRFDREILVSPPNAALRKTIFRVNLYRTPYVISSESQENAEKEKLRDKFLNTLAAKAVGYVGADIVSLCREAAMIASTRQLVALSQDRELEQWWVDWKRRGEPLTAAKGQSTTLGSIVAGRAWHANPAAIIPLWFLVKQSKHNDAGKNAEKDQQQVSQSGFFHFLLGIEQKHTFASPCHVKDEEKTARSFGVTMSDFDQAMQTIVPSALRGASGFMRDFERHSWDSIGGQVETKRALQQALEWPIKYPQTFARLGVKPPRGVLLYGPPGCSKSSVVRAAAHSSGATFLSLSAAQVFSPFLGDAEAAVRQVFRDARAALPAIVFFDEIDVMVAKRDFDGSGNGEGTNSSATRVLSTMLNEMDGVESAEGLLVIGATNRPACIDAALMRPGRFDRIVFVDLPTESDRVDILRIHSRPMQLHDDVDLISLANRTPFFSGAELEVQYRLVGAIRQRTMLPTCMPLCYVLQNLCREAALLALRESLDAKNVRMCHFDKALCDIIPVSSNDSMSTYMDFAEAMGHLS
uniref:AAA+ ATPase domain-containing protein n=1 Tax=Hyaloperonospora arabidopsidis (strain Emoy2) TaxID=559515 RepID=M4B515_HYAAE